MSGTTFVGLWPRAFFDGSRATYAAPQQPTRN
jgi:hypothetical protein